MVVASVVVEERMAKSVGSMLEQCFRVIFSQTSVSSWLASAMCPEATVYWQDPMGNLASAKRVVANFNENLSKFCVVGVYHPCVYDATACVINAYAIA